MQRHDWSSMSQKEPMLHLSLSPCTGSWLQLASSSKHWCLHIEQPQAQHPPTSTHWWQSTSLPEVWDPLVSDASWYHHREAQNHFPEYSRSPWWNDLHTPIRNAGSLSTFKQQLKNHLFRHYLTSSWWSHNHQPDQLYAKKMFLHCVRQMVVTPDIDWFSNPPQYSKTAHFRVAFWHTCAIIMLSNKNLDMPHLWGGWIISANNTRSLTQI